MEVTIICVQKSIFLFHRCLFLIFSHNILHMVSYTDPLIPHLSYYLTDSFPLSL